MFKKIALATITAAALVAPPSLSYAEICLNGHNLNGVSINGLTLNGLGYNGLTLNGVRINGLTLNGLGHNGLTLNGVSINGLTLNGVEPAGREVYVVGERTGGESSTVLTIELPQGHVGR